MAEKEEFEREQRIRLNAEISYQNSKLPPRMQAHQDLLKQQKPAPKPRPQKLPRARSVPNFKHLQQAFIQKFESQKQSKPTTQPEPF